MRRLGAIAGWMGLCAVVALAVVILFEAHGSDEYWPVAWPGVLTGAGTLALAGVTFRVLLGDQRDRRSREERERRLDERERRAQADAISGWYGGIERYGAGGSPDDEPPTKMYVLNRSDSPVYRVVVTLAFLSGSPPHTGEAWVAATGHLPFAQVFGSVPPGRYRVDTDSGWGAHGARPGVEVAFTDRSGYHWIRRADGRLDEIEAEGMTHYGLEGAFSLEAIGEPVD